MLLFSGAIGNANSQLYRNKQGVGRKLSRKRPMERWSWPFY